MNNKQNSLKCILTLLLVFYLVNCGAQNWFIGGNVSLSVSDQEQKNFTDYYSIREQSENSISTIIRPTLGYKLEKSDVGIYPIFQFTKTEGTQVDEYIGNYDRIATENYTRESTGIGTGLFYRYNFFTKGKFSILGRVDLSYLYRDSDANNERVTGYSERPREEIIISETDTKSHTFSLDLTPVFEYKISNRFSLFTDLNIREIGCSFTRSTEFYVSETNVILEDDILERTSYNDRKTTRNSFNFKGSTSTLFSITDSFSIGLLMYF